LKSLIGARRATTPAQHGEGIEDGAVADKIEHRIELLGFSDPLGKLRSFRFDALCAELFQQGDTLTTARGRDDPYARIDRHVERSLAEGGRRASNDQCLSPCDLQIAEEACPGGCIGFRDRGELGPGQIGLDERDVRRPHPGIFGVAAIDGAPEAAHQRGNLGSDRELATGTRFYQPDALDADHFRRLGPLASAHVHLGVIDTERLDFDNDVTSLWLRVGDLLVNEAV
jgi:hypothetical protein